MDPRFQRSSSTVFWLSCFVVLGAGLFAWWQFMPKGDPDAIDDGRAFNLDEAPKIDDQGPGIQYTTEFEKQREARITPGAPGSKEAGEPARPGRPKTGWKTDEPEVDAQRRAWERKFLRKNARALRQELARLSKVTSKWRKEHKVVREVDDSHQVGICHRRRQRIRALMMQPNAVSHGGRQLPSLDKPFAGYGMIEAEQVLFDVANADVLAVHALHHSGVTLGEARIERDLADVVQESAHERLAAVL